MTRHEPLHGLAIAVTRRDPQDTTHADWTSEQRISAEEALAAYSLGVAYQAFAEADRGHLSRGAAADVAWLSADPRAVDPNEIHTVTVRGTWLAGEQTFGEDR